MPLPRDSIAFQFTYPEKQNQAFGDYSGYRGLGRGQAGPRKVQRPSHLYSRTACRKGQNHHVQCPPFPHYREPLWLTSQQIIFTQDYYVSDILFLLANSAAKASVGLLIRRINREERYRRICHSLLAFIAIWTIASAIAVGLECNFHYPPPWVGRCTAVVRFEILVLLSLETITHL